MLPFLKNKQDAGSQGPVDVQRREPDEDSESYDPMHSAADDLISAIHAKDTKGVAEALRAAHELNNSPEGEES